MTSVQGLGMYPFPTGSLGPNCGVKTFQGLRSVLMFDELGAAQTARIAAASHSKVLVCDFSIAS